jgi:hypothetical protein
LDDEGHGRHLACSLQPAGTSRGGPSHPCPAHPDLSGSGFLSADVGVLGPAVATRPAVPINIATGVRPEAWLERVIADIRLQLAEVIIHHGPPLSPADDPVRRRANPEGPVLRGPPPRAGPPVAGLLWAHGAHGRPWTGPDGGYRSSRRPADPLTELRVFGGGRDGLGRSRWETFFPEGRLPTSVPWMVTDAPPKPRSGRCWELCPSHPRPTIRPRRLPNATFRKSYVGGWLF